MDNRDSNNRRTELICSFCGKSSSQVKRIIVGPDVNICNECVELCESLISEDNPLIPQMDTNLPKPE